MENMAGDQNPIKPAGAGHQQSANQEEPNSESGGQGGKQEEAATKEEFKVSGDQVVEKIKELVRQGNIRKISLKNEEGKTLIEIPLTLGLVGAALLPVWAAIGAIAALVARLTIVVEKRRE